MDLMQKVKDLQNRMERNNILLFGSEDLALKNIQKNTDFLVK